MMESFAHEVDFLTNLYILNAKKPAPGKDIKIYEKKGTVKV